MAPLSVAPASSLIEVYRVYVSGEPQTFDSLKVAMDYLRAEALYNRIEDIRFETAHLSQREYRVEVLLQEARS